VISPNRDQRPPFPDVVNPEQATAIEQINCARSCCNIIQSIPSLSQWRLTNGPVLLTISGQPN